MIAEITRIDHIKNSRNFGELFIRVHFKLEGGGWAKTDICPGFRNYSRWKKILRVGNRLFNLRMLDGQTVDADSYPRLLEGRRKYPQPGLEELSKLGTFG